MMKKSSWFGYILGLIFLVIGNSTMAADYDKLDTYLSRLVNNKKATLAVAIHKDGKLVYQFAGGYADEDLKVNLTNQSKFRIGSITKTYTATVILKLVEQGKLSLTTPLSKYFPEIPDSDEITVEQLLRHESGLFNFTNAPEYIDYMYEAQSNDALMKSILKNEASFKPGEQQEYSNTNYILLGFIAEKVTGKSLAELIQLFISEPLGLTSTYLSSSNLIAEGEVWSYRYQGDWESLPNTHLSIPQGAGAIVANADEVGVFLTRLFTGDILSKQQVAKMTEIKQHLGLGVMKFPFYDRQGIGHNGGIDGFNSNASYFFEDKISAVVLSNGINFNFNDILIAVLSAQFDKPFELPEFTTKPVSLSINELETFVGNYSSQQLPLDIKVFVQDERLMAQASGQGAFDLTSFSDNEFRFDRAGITIKFNSDKSGFTLIQGGGQYYYSKQ